MRNAYRQNILRLDISKSLDVIKDEPSERNDHENDEGNRYKEYGSSIDVSITKSRVRTDCQLSHDSGRSIRQEA
jgi:hypothetical protein